MIVDGSSSEARARLAEGYCGFGTATMTMTMMMMMMTTTIPSSTNVTNNININNLSYYHSNCSILSIYYR